MPRPAATGIASASRPIRIRRVMPSTSTPSANLAILQVANLILDLFLGRARADQCRHAAQIAREADPEGLKEQDDANHDERREARDPQHLRNNSGCLERRLAARP